MADDRKIHNRCLRSERVSHMSDLEFHVWMTHQLGADDCGVMPMTVAELQAKNQALEERPARKLMAALESLVFVRLLLKFVHQGRAYVCQTDWQDYQKIRFPRESHYPIPPSDVLSACSEQTRELFDLRIRKRSEPAPSVLGEYAERMSHPTRAGDRAEPLTTNHQPVTTNPERSDPADLMVAWNTFTFAPIPQCRELSQSRRRTAAVRLRERSLSDWRAVIQRIEASEFCKGQNERGWVATFDWLLKPETAVRVLEGKYDNRPVTKALNGTVRETAAAHTLRESRELLAALSPDHSAVAVKGELE